MISLALMLWQASLERSLARRGKSTRSSLELFHLRPERDLSCVDLLRESSAYSAAAPFGGGPSAGDVASRRRRDLGACAAGGDDAPGTARWAWRRRPDGADHLPRRCACVPAAQGQSRGSGGVAERGGAGRAAARDKHGRVGEPATATAAQAHAVSTHPSTPAVHSSRPATVTHTPHVAAAHDAAASAGGAAGIARGERRGRAGGAAQRIGAVHCAPCGPRCTHAGWRPVRWPQRARRLRSIG